MVVWLYNYQKTLSQSLSELWDKITDGTIARDISSATINNDRLISDTIKGFKGYLEGYRDVRDNAPWYARLILKIGITSVEWGMTKSFVPVISESYDFTSGYYFDTIPTSYAGLAGYYARQYTDAFLNENIKYYDINNLIPIPLPNKE